MRAFNSPTPFADKQYNGDNQTISAESVTSEVTSVDADTPINFPPLDGQTMSLMEEPRFLEQVQLFVDKAASKTNVQADMLKYIMACDHVLRF